MWRRAAWAAILLLLISIITDRAIGEHRSSNVFGIIKVTRRTVMNLINAHVTEAPLSDEEAAPRFESIVKRYFSLLGILGGVESQSIATSCESCTWISDLSSLTQFFDCKTCIGIGNYFVSSCRILPFFLGESRNDVCAQDIQRWLSAGILILNGNIESFALNKATYRNEIWADPSPICGNESITRCPVSALQSAELQRGNDDQNARVSSNPSGEFGQWFFFLKPPWPLKPFFGANACFLAIGFTLLFGPSRRETLGAALFFGSALLLLLGCSVGIHIGILG